MCSDSVYFLLETRIALGGAGSPGTRHLAVRRNPKRFPEDFMFQLSREETQSLLLQNARAKGRGGRRTPPYAFTEQGVSMLSSVLNSERAIEVNIAIMRAFVRLRAMLATHADLARRLNELEQKYDEQFRVVFEAIRELMAPSQCPRPGALDSPLRINEKTKNNSVAWVRIVRTGGRSLDCGHPSSTIESASQRRIILFARVSGCTCTRQPGPAAC
ncbi:MAG: hypothetical protein DMG16_19690 [Acidobacteria bacterium]|nr:MAG: hypothetical protein DMG16_19690 [Acidobacteriota bacterium]